MFNVKSWLMFSSVVFSIILTFNTPCFASHDLPISDIPYDKIVNTDTITVNKDGLVQGWVYFRYWHAEYKFNTLLKQSQTVFYRNELVQCDCLDKTSRTIETLFYGKEKKVLAKELTPSASFEKVMRNADAQTTLELFCKAKESLKQGVSKVELYDVLAKQMRTKDQPLTEDAVSMLLKASARDINNAKYALSKSNAKDANNFIQRADYWLSALKRMIEKDLDNQEHPLVETFYSQKIELAKLQGDTKTVDLYSGLLKAYKKRLNDLTSE